MTTLGIGTLVVVGLRFVTGTNWIWLAELAAFAASGKAYVSGKEIDDRKRKQSQEKWIRSRKQSVIGSIKHELDSWFDNKKYESESKVKEVLTHYQKMLTQKEAEHDAVHAKFVELRMAQRDIDAYLRQYAPQAQQDEQQYQQEQSRSQRKKKKDVLE